MVKKNKKIGEALTKEIKRIKEEYKQRQEGYEKQKKPLREEIERLKKDRIEDPKESYFYKKEQAKAQRKLTGLNIRSGVAKVESKVEIGLARVTNKIGKALKKRVVSRKVFRPSQMVTRIKETQPAPYVSRYFKQELEDAKKSMFFE